MIRPETLKQIEIDLYKKSLYHLCKYGLEMNDISWDTHGGMIRNLESNTKRKLCVMPRGTLKSSLGVVGYSIWCLIRDPNERILIDSEVYENSKNFLREIKAHLESEKMTDLFGEFKSSPWSEGEIVICQRTKPYKEASITCGGVGTGKTGAHFNRILYDDLNGAKNSLTTEARAKVFRHYRMGISLLEPDGTVCIIGTRYATDDVIGNVLESMEIKQ